MSNRRGGTKNRVNREGEGRFGVRAQMCKGQGEAKKE